MISTLTIPAEIKGKKSDVELICDNKTISIKLQIDNSASKSYTGGDFYKCFGSLREDNPDMKFFCKGSKINVHTSSMSSQMSMGLKAYELTLGKEADLEDIVFIFDYEDQNLTNDPKKQREFYLEWIKS